MNKNKIVIDCRMHHLSGIGRYIKDLVPSICGAFENVVLIGNRKDLSIYTVAFPNTKIIDVIAPIYSLKEQWVLFTKIPKCDIFWSPHYNIPILPIKAKYRIVTIHDANHLAFYNQLSLPQKIYAKLFYNGALKKSDKIITISNFSKNELLKYTLSKYDSKISVIYRFVGDIITRLDDEHDRQIDIFEVNPYLLFVGNVKPHKNLRNALLAFKKIIADKNLKVDARLVFKIVGKKDGFINGEEGIQDIVDNDSELNKRVQFTGHVSDVGLEQLYRNAVCMVFPSIYEGFGLPPLEAMVFGCATITSNAASLPEVCGDATLYFDPFKVDDIANKMVKIITSPETRDNLISKGYEQVKKFNKSTAVQAHIDLFKSVGLKFINNLSNKTDK